MLILSIETSCDETAMSLVEAGGDIESGPKFKILKDLVSSQIEIHRPFGGVVPNLAKREHLKNLPILFGEIRNYESGIMNKIDLIAVTVGPGLEPALWTGINFAKDMGKKYSKPVIGVNHLEGHLVSFLLPKRTESLDHQTPSSEYWKSIFPAIALIASGGHTILIYANNITTQKKLGETRDDAVGEAFDKVARLLGLPYPGGPEIEKLAKEGNRKAIDFPRPMINEKNFDFSFSGLKTSVLYYLRDNKYFSKEDVAASFEKSAIDVLVKKTEQACLLEKPQSKSIILSGGVASNKLLQEEMKKMTNKINRKLLIPDSKYNTDNATMIAAAGYINYLTNVGYPLGANGNLEINYFQGED